MVNFRRFCGVLVGGWSFDSRGQVDQGYRETSRRFDQTTMRIKKSVASKEYNLSPPNDPKASKLLLTMLLQVATNDGRLPSVEQSAVRKIGKLLDLDDSYVEDSIRRLKGTSDRVEPLVTKTDSRASEMDINSPEEPALRLEVPHRV